MTKRDYELVARVLRAHVEDARCDGPTIVHLCAELAIAMKQANDRMDINKFLKACGFGDAPTEGGF